MSGKYMLGCVIVVGILMPACTRSESATDVVPAGAFPAATPEVRDVVITREYVADVRAARHAEVRSRFKGVVEAVLVDEGQTVKAGQLLFTINARARKQDLAVARAAIAAADAELKAAQLEVDNIQILADKNVVSAAEVARARSKAELLRARLDEAKAGASRTSIELERAEIRAPFDGVIHRLPYKAGSLIDENAELTTISDTREILAYFSIAEREYLELIKGQGGATPRHVRLEMADGSEFEHEGTVDAVGSEIDAATGTLIYRARFPNPEGLLKHGSSAKVVLAKQLRDAVVVPQRSTFEVQGTVYLYTVDTKSVAHARKVTVKERLDEAFVLEGITATERFVVEGIQKLRHGMRIEIAPATGSGG